MRSYCRICCPAGVETSYARLDFLRDWALCPHELRACGPATRRWSEAMSLITTMRNGNPDKTGGSRNSSQLLVWQGCCQRGRRRNSQAFPEQNSWLAHLQPDATTEGYRLTQMISPVYSTGDTSCLCWAQLSGLHAVNPAVFVSSTFLIPVSRRSLDLIQVLSFSADLPLLLPRMRYLNRTLVATFWLLNPQAIESV